jgi:hypothetical protein
MKYVLEELYNLGVVASENLRLRPKPLQGRFSDYEEEVQLFLEAIKTRKYTFGIEGWRMNLQNLFPQQTMRI